MVDAVNVDDTDPSIVYSGSWEVLTDNPLEFGSGVHSTTQKGASATITFKGTRLQMFCTVANGNGNETADFVFDGRAGPSLIRNSHPDMSYYKDGWFDSGPVPDAVHVLTVSNGGGPSDTPFQIDYFTVNGSIVSPSGTQASASATSAISTASISPSAGTAAAGQASAVLPGTKSPIGAIIGGVIGGIVFVAFLLFLVLLYRRHIKARQASFADDDKEAKETGRPRTMTSITPFQLDPHPSATLTSGDSTANLPPDSPSSVTEKNSLPFSDPSQHPSPPSSHPSSTPASIPPDTEIDDLSRRQHHLSDAPPSYQA